MKTPNPSPEKRMVDWFSAGAEKYQQASRAGLWDWWRRRERDAIFALLRPRTGEAILDAGCGAGYYAEEMHRRGVAVVGFDLSPAMATALHRRTGIPAFAGNLQQFALQPGRFHAVLCAGALEFVPSPRAAFRALGRAVDPGARLVVMLPNDDLSGRLYRRFHLRHGFRIQLFSPERLRTLGLLAGLRLTTLRRIGFNWVARYVRAGGSA